MQHKTQLGGNKFIPTVRVFKPDGNSLAWFVFYIGPDPDPTSNAASEEVLIRRAKERLSVVHDTHVTKRRDDGRNVVREHVFRLRL
jgi:hypothetical protein